MKRAIGHAFLASARLWTWRPQRLEISGGRAEIGLEDGGHLPRRPERATDKATWMGQARKELPIAVDDLYGEFIARQVNAKVSSLRCQVALHLGRILHVRNASRDDVRDGLRGVRQGTHQADETLNVIREVRLWVRSEKCRRVDVSAGVRRAGPCFQQPPSARSSRERLAVHRAAPSRGLEIA